MEARDRRLTWWMGGLAAAGVLFTHWLTYRLALPDAHHRAHVLHHTGHAHWPVVSTVGLALFTVASLRLRGRFRLTLPRLAGLQAAAWIALEVGERGASGSLSTLDDHAVVLVGLGLQVAVALLGAFLVRLAVQVLSSWARRAERPRRSTAPALRPRVVRARPLLPLAGAHGLRGPPLTTSTP